MCTLKLPEVSSISPAIQRVSRDCLLALHPFRNAGGTATLLVSRVCLLGLALHLMVSGSVHAALIAYEGFDYPDGTDISASGANGGSGWITPWGVNSAGTTIAGNTPGDTNYAGSMSYVDTAGNTLVTTGGRSFYTGQPGTSQPFRDFAATGAGRGADNTTTWISVLIVRGGPVSDNPTNIYPRGANISFFDGNTERFGVGNVSGAPDNLFSLIQGGSIPNRRPSTNPPTPYNQVSFAVVRIDHLPGNDNAYLFVNPTLGVEPPLSAAGAQTIGLFNYTFNRARPFAGNTDTATSRPYAEITLDELRIGETYADVTPFIPGIMPGKNVTWVGTAGANWDTNTANWRTNSGPLTTFVDGDFVRFDDTAAGATNVVLVGTLSPFSVTVNNELLSYKFTGSGRIGFIGGLTKSGSGSLTVDNSGMNTFSGPIVIEAGTVQVGSGETDGNLGPGPITNNAALLVNRSGSLTMNNAISGSGTLTKNGTGSLILGGSSSYTGATELNGGALFLDGMLSGGGSIMTAAGTTLGGSGMSAGSVIANGLIYPGSVNAAGTLAVGGVVLNADATLKFDLSAGNTVGSGSNDLIQISGDLDVSGNSIAVNFIAFPQVGVPYRLINYSGAQVGNFNPAVTGTHFTATLDQSTPGQVNVTLSGAGASLKWNSTSSSAWDLGTTTNWLNLSSSMPDVFYAGDSVLFDDTVADVVTSVNLGAGVSVAPTTITVSASANNFTFAGAGRITGPATLVKDGTSTLTLSNANDFTGTVTINGGILKVGNATALGGGAAGTTINAGGTLDVNGLNLSAEAITASGSGAGDGGAIINSGADQINALRSVTLAGNTTFGGTRRWDIRNSGGINGSLSASPPGTAYTITKVGTNQISLVAVTTIDSALGDIDIKEGVFAIQTTTGQVGDPNKTITVSSGATLNLYNLSTPLNKLIVLQDGATFWNENGASTNQGSIVLEGRGIFNVASAGATPMLLINGEISGAGELIKIGAGPLRLSGPFNAYMGATTVSNGTLFVDGNNEGSGTFTVYAGTLGGIGSISAPVIITTGGTLSPGSSNTAIGTLTINNTLSLAGTNVMDVSRSGPSLLNDRVAGIITLTLGGTLRLNITGSPLLEGDAFDLFDFTSASGSFATITPATPGAGLRWDTNRLRVDGTLAVVAAPRPVFGTVSLSGTNMVMLGTNGTPGATFYVLSSTNVALPLAQWARVSTNMFDGGGNFNITNAVNPTTRQRFFMLDAP